MLKYNNKFLKIILVAFFPIFAMAQNSTNSPYTRFGWGQLSDNTMGSSASMGGVSIGVRSSSQINPSNPASYTDIEPENFLFDFGLYGQISKFDANGNKQDFNNAGINHLAIAFPISSKMGMSIGLLPYSSIGYNFNTIEYVKLPNGLNSSTVLQQDFEGNGGISYLYAGIGYEVMKNLSIGLNIGYLFGNVSNERSVTFPNETALTYFQHTQEIKVRDVKFDLGIHYTHRLNAKENLTFGFTYSPKKQMSANSEMNVYSGTGTSTADSTVTTKEYGGFQLPHSFDLGISYNKDNRLTLAADLDYQMWKDAKFYKKTDSLNNKVKIALGGEYVHSQISKNLFKVIHYRAGVSYERSYANINGHSLDIYSATLGFGIPFKGTGSLLNIGFEYRMAPSSVVNKLEESNYRIMVGVVFNERWFRKRVFN